MKLPSSRTIAFAIPGNIDLPTGGYAYDRRVMTLLPDYGVQASLIELPGTFPNPTSADLAETLRLLSSATDPFLIDGLAWGTMPPAVTDKLTQGVLALVHHPLCLESGLTPQRAAELKETETAALARANHVIVTSFATKRILVRDFDVPTTKITVAEPGTDPTPRATGTGTPMQLLAVGAISARKGYDVLIEALSSLRHLEWRLTIAGATDRDRDAVSRLEQAITSHKLHDRVRLAGTVVPATLSNYYDSADLFVMSSHFEGYGMVIAEAMARGLPIVCTTGSASAEIVPDTAAIKVPPGDAAALSAAIEKALGDKRLRARLADASWEMGRTLPPWTETTRRIAAVVMGLAP